MEELNDGVLQAIEKHALTPEAIESVVALSERDDGQQQVTLAKGYEFSAETRFDRLFEGGVWQPMDRLSDDIVYPWEVGYGQLLDRVKVVASPSRSVKPVRVSGLFRRAA